MAAEKTKMAVVAAVVLFLSLGGAGVAVWSILSVSGGSQVVRANEATEPPPEGSLRVQFEDGWTADLVAIGEEPAEEWWLPDGSPALDPQVRSRLPDEPAPEARQLHFIFSGDQLDPEHRISVLTSAPQPIPSDRGALSTTWPRMQTRYGASSIIHTTNLPEREDTGTLRLGRASGPWNSVFHFDAATMEPISVEGDKVVRLLSISERDGITWFEADVLPSERLELHEHISIILDTGRELTPHVYSGRGRRGEIMKLYGFEVPQEQVKEFIYRSRPYEVIELRDVALRPGVQTDPAVVRVDQQVDEETAPQ